MIVSCDREWNDLRDFFILTFTLQLVFHEYDMGWIPITTGIFSLEYKDFFYDCFIVRLGLKHDQNLYGIWTWDHVDLRGQTVWRSMTLHYL
jgi:hypothetical protein